ncbi:MAG TPA: family 16 glycoside hydrolase [Nitrospira sp.]|nr:family 16 glycoside hydrolase [Nitrospira sp.]
MINRLIESGQPVEVQDTTFTTDVMGRYVCSTWDEAVNNGGVMFDAVVIGAGMFGAYCAEKIYRNANLRVLVLDAGGFLVSEHVQNLARIGLNAGPTIQVAANSQDPGTRNRVWGSPWRSQVGFPGLAYCLGGRSLYWGGWAPRLTDADFANWPTEIVRFLKGPRAQWPSDLAAFLAPVPPAPIADFADGYEAVERETGVFDKTDYISGPLNAELTKQFTAVFKTVPALDSIEEAPLAVQAAPPASGLFSFDKYSSAPILADAIREAASNPDWRRRLFLVPRAHVVKLHTTGNTVTQIEVYVNGQQKVLTIPSTCAIVIASSTIEATRLAMTSFPTPLMGRNLMAHLRSNTIVRIKRAAFDPALPKQLEAAALLVRGSTPQGRFHFQVTAAAVMGADSEATMWRMIPDIDLVDRTLASELADSIVITLRGIGEMKGSQDSTVAKTTGTAPNWLDLSPDQTDEYGFQRAWVNLAKSQADDTLWNTMDDAAIVLAQKLAKNAQNIEYQYDGGWHPAPPPRGKVRDGLGTTHHEAGTLWMGTDFTTSVTGLDGRFHHIVNAYVAGPALFPTLGSANPSLTALSLARVTAAAIAKTSLPVETGFRTIGRGGLDGWQMAGSGSFIELGNNIIETIDGIGLLWYTREQFANFILRVDWRATYPDDNSGIFIRFPALGSSDPANDWKLAVDQGYEIQIDDTGTNPDVNPPTFGDPLHITGSVYKLAPATKVASRPLGQWNAYEIQAKGNDITVTLNGQLVSTLKNGNRPKQGYIGLQNHHFGSRVQFRNIRIQPI